MSEVSATYQAGDSGKPVDVFDLQSITDLVNDYNIALMEERAALVELNDLRGAVETERARILADGYASEAINGKNEAARKLQEAALLEESNALYWLDVLVRKAQMTADVAEIDRKMIETEISLTKAWLYSQSGVGRG